MPINALQFSLPNIQIEQIKRSALLFQTIYYCHMPIYLAYRPTYQWQVEGIELEMPLEHGLERLGIIKHVDDAFKSYSAEGDALDVELQGLKAVKPTLTEVKIAMENSPLDDEFKIIRYIEMARALARDAANDIRSRRSAADLEQELGERVVPILTSANMRVGHPDTRTDLLHVILKQMPLPDKETPWEAIFDWRRDEDAQTQYRRLIAAIGTAAEKGTHPSEFRDEIATRLDDYRSAMAIHHSKMQTSRLEVFFITSLEILEDVFHARFGGAAKKLLSIGRAETDLLENELKIPGREFAYIASVNARFDGDGSEPKIDPRWLDGGVLY